MYLPDMNMHTRHTYGRCAHAHTNTHTRNINEEAKQEHKKRLGTRIDARTNTWNGGAVNCGIVVRGWPFWLHASSTLDRLSTPITRGGVTTSAHRTRRNKIPVH